MAGTPPYRTVRVCDFQYLDAMGRPNSQVTVQTIEAQVALTEIPYSFGTPHVAAVTAISGCLATPVMLREPGVWGCQLRIFGTLLPGEQVTITYETRFAYSQPPAPVLRRYTGTFGIDALEVAVMFDNVRLPTAAHWGVWEGLQDGAQVIPDSVADVPLRPVDHGAEGVVARYSVTNLPPEQVVGLFWEWQK